MRQDQLKSYLEARLEELKKKKDLEEIESKGKMSFGMDSTRYGHLPGWKDLVKRKKKMIRNVWIQAFFLSLLLVPVLGKHLYEPGHGRAAIILYWLASAAITMVFYVVWSFYSLFFEFRLTEREVRKLIYEDIIFQIEKISTEEKDRS